MAYVNMILPLARCLEEKKSAPEILTHSELRKKKKKTTQNTGIVLARGESEILRFGNRSEREVGGEMGKQDIYLSY